MLNPAPVKSVCATKEIVLSAGSIGTPIILQRSGIGNHSILSSLGIETIVNNPSVGANLTDHPILTNSYLVKGNGSFDEIFANETRLDSAMSEWETTRKGPLTDGVSNHVGWLRIPDNSSIFESVPDPAAGPKASHWEILFNVGRRLTMPFPC